MQLETANKGKENTSNSPEKAKEGELDQHESLLQQIDFLNSIIGDNSLKLQQKDNEIKELERLLIIGDINKFDQQNLNGDPNDATVYDDYGNELPRKSERAYCDICEIFDAHETEECPIQGGEDMPEPLVNLKEKFGGRADKSRYRSYCDICEIFDAHETEECPIQGGAGDGTHVEVGQEWDDDETY